MAKPNHLIVMADDDVDERYLMQHAFADLGMEDSIRIFDSGEDAITYILKLAQLDIYPDLILLDYHMPRMNGGEVLQQLKRLPLFSAIPVVLFSTDFSPLLEQRLLEMGATALVRKGFSVAECNALALRIAEIIESHQKIAV